MPVFRPYLKAGVALCGFLHASPAPAVDVIPPFSCLPAESVVSQAELRHGEAPVHAGEAINGQVDLWLDETDGSWTLLGMIPGTGLACVIGSGEFPPAMLAAPMPPEIWT